MTNLPHDLETIGVMFLSLNFTFENYYTFFVKYALLGDFNWSWECIYIFKLFCLLSLWIGKKSFTWNSWVPRRFLIFTDAISLNWFDGFSLVLELVGYLADAKVFLSAKESIAVDFIKSLIFIYASFYYAKLYLFNL